MKAYMLKGSLFCFLFLSGFFRPHAQAGMNTHYPEIGQPLPNITLSEIKDYRLKKASTKDFKGKWVILDFWFAGCATCLRSFPHSDTMQKKYGPKLQIMLVGETGSGDDRYLRKMYEKYKARYNLNLANAYDSILEHYLGIRGYPYLAWVDNHGIVQALTSSDELNDKNIQAFLSGKKLNLPEIESFKTLKINGYLYDYEKPIFLNDNGGSDSAFLYRSMLTKWPKKIPGSTPTRIGDVYPWNDKDVFQTVGAGLKWLYRLAYSGKSYYDVRDSLYQIWYTDPVLEIADPAPFDMQDVNNRFCYNFIFPAEKYNPQYVQQALQRDLNLYFGYQVSVESRMMPCWNLTCDDSVKSKLRTKGVLDDSKSIDQGIGKLIYNNSSIYNIIDLLWNYNQNEPPFVDKTGINFKIDLELDCIKTDFEDLRRELAKNGLHLGKGQKLTKVIVIKDAPGQGNSATGR